VYDDNVPPLQLSRAANMLLLFVGPWVDDS